MTFHVEARRVDAHGSHARCKDAEIALGTDLASNPDAFNPAELLLVALSACRIKGIERVTPRLHFSLRGVEVKVDGIRSGCAATHGGHSLRGHRGHGWTWSSAGTAARQRETVRHGLQHNPPGTALSGVLPRKEAQP